MPIDRPIFVSVASTAQIQAENGSQLCVPGKPEGEQLFEHWTLQGQPIDGSVTSLDITIGDSAFTIVVPAGKSCSVRFHISDPGGAGLRPKPKK